jgi:2'-5' RNA ligase
MKTIRLIIITVPPGNVAEHIQRLRKPICTTYQSPWALTYPPHVTLRTGVRVPEDRIAKFLKQFGALLDGRKPFPIRTEKTSWSTMEYEGKRKFFLYLPVIKDEPLVSLNRHLLTYKTYRKSDKMTFHPHVTLLWDNLTVDEQEEVKAYVAHDARFHMGFEWICDNVSLYVQKQNIWVPFHVYPLQ